MELKGSIVVYTYYYQVARDVLFFLRTSRRSAHHCIKLKGETAGGLV
jgi:hypothetical protein